MRVLFKSPGWAPPGLPPFAPPDETRLRQPRFASRMEALDVARAISLFLVTAAATATWLDAAEDLGEGRNLLAAAVVAIGLSATGAMLTRGVHDGQLDGREHRASDRSSRRRAWGIYLGAMALCVGLIAVMVG
ncbi:hypothetical protein OU995_18920 [Roseateles sp. SL47]|uniref:hypothetical protein n=1 Tax=Roseateles sp. SL47 TaxID=2995138 RepID=UPI002271846F|nr:hypothetical protein [Roseateles sp. SL47]WAC71642.1 hypothetical protein OU995_18920 [Roseateles sp. SL47]